DGHVTGVQTCALPIWKSSCASAGKKAAGGLAERDFGFADPEARPGARGLRGQPAGREWTTRAIREPRLRTERRSRHFVVAETGQIGRASCRERVWSGA